MRNIKVAGALALALSGPLQQVAFYVIPPSSAAFAVANASLQVEHVTSPVVVFVSFVGDSHSDQVRRVCLHAVYTRV